MIELLVVVAIILIVAAFAVPTMTTTLDAYRLRSALNSSMAMVQRARLTAIKKNETQQLNFITSANQVVLYYKDQNAANPALVTKWTGATTSPDPQFWFPTQFSIPGAPTGGPTPLTAMVMWGTTLNPNYDQAFLFNSRGMPCVVLNPGAACTPTTGYVYYFKYKNAKRTRWAAVSVSSAGRIESWFWDQGKGWGN